MKLKQKIERWCKEEGITEEQFARAIRVSPSAFNRYKNGKRRPEKEITEAFYYYTEGFIEPNDFYDLEEFKNKPSKSKKK